MLSRKTSEGTMLDSHCNNANATGTADAFEEFKSLSNAFRSGILTGDEYYTRCSQLLGARMGVIYPELVALLPDLRLQSALVEAYDRHHRAGQVGVRFHGMF
eukprot:TRINITY_DN7531_c0_g1_i2.p7 TRINITY_DN7531_c0_g1~~TRINITY_DN7531_c0_g1_i2.p7  ORF type:complete len:102 (+),score=17.65 TRINITY_DN7531_c0_g1_i2:2354-2659(+)